MLDQSTRQTVEYSMPVWVFWIAAAVGMVALLVVIVRRPYLPQGYFAPLAVTLTLFTLGSFAASFFVPLVDVVTVYSSGEAEDNGTTLEVGETTIQ